MRLSLAAAESAAGDAQAAEVEIRVALSTLNNGSDTTVINPGAVSPIAIPAQAALAALLLKGAAAARAAVSVNASPTVQDQEALGALSALLGAQRAALGVFHPFVADTLGKLGNLHRAAGRAEVRPG